LKVEKQTLENHRAKISVEVEPEQIEKAKQRAARQLASHVKIPGFRPGKAPYHIIERTLGIEAILQQAYEILGEDIFPKALDEAGLKPYAPAEFKPPSEQAPTTFEFTFPMEAEVDLGEYRSIRIPYELPPTSEEEVEKTLTDLRERNALIEPVERAAQAGDEITIKLSGKRTQPDEGEDPTLINERSQTILIKTEDDSSEWPFPGFSQQMVGLSAGEEKTVIFTFPDDSAFTSLRGKEAEYHIEVEQVKSRTLPELNDEFAKSIGDFETLQALQDTIRDGLKSQAKANYDSEYNEKALAKVIEGATIQYPAEMVEDQITASTERMKNQLVEQGQEFETYLKIRGMDAAAFREQNRPQAETAIKRSVVMYELARAEAITVEREEMESEAMNTLNDLMRYVSPDRFKRMSKDRNFISQLSRNASVDVLSRKTFERLNAIAKGEAAANEAAASEAAAKEAVVGEAVANETPVNEAAVASGVTASETAAIDDTPVTETQPGMDTPAEAEAPQVEEPASAEIPVPETTQQEG
jgi:trigger factor